ncbi:MAG: (E)-4-hydroxy-3-methylbut-2-enyl-diphosphate synthase [Treponemataceae bacterium]
MGEQITVPRAVKIGGFDHVESVIIGGEYPVSVQTMWKDRLTRSDVEGSAGGATLARIEKLKVLGCSLLRFAVPDLAAADILGLLATRTSMPIVADIHFDHEIALRCLDYPIAKIRINPGNIGSRAKVEAVVRKAIEKGVPLRIGVNAGSLPLDLAKQVDSGVKTRAEALVEAAEREVSVFDDLAFSNVLVSMKASSITDTLRANELFASRHTIPLHLGVTEAGPLIPGIVRNAVALHTLLAKGIGSTIRVSLSDTMECEVLAGREILGAVADTAGKGNKGRGVVIVSCPRCGRNGFDTHAFSEKWRDELYSLKKDAVVAIMGCAVNGPGEARHADLGITGAGDKVLIFRQGHIVRTVDPSDADTAFHEELAKL